MDFLCLSLKQFALALIVYHAYNVVDEDQKVHSYHKGANVKELVAQLVS